MQQLRECLVYKNPVLNAADESSLLFFAVCKGAAHTYLTDDDANVSIFMGL